MISINVSRKAFVVLCLAFVCGCSTEPSSNLTTGMNMEDAVSEMKKQGMEPQVMGFKGEHSAFDLADGRTVVLMGAETIEKIYVIVNPDKPKSEREIETVASFKI